MCGNTSNGATLVAENGGDPDIDRPVVECPLEKSKITAIEWLDGNDTTTVRDKDHFVNLPRDAKWLNGSGIPNIDRLGMQPRVKVTFDKAAPCNFDWRLVPVEGTTPIYTTAEEGRNPNFLYTKGWQQSSCAAGELIMPTAVNLVAGGGYKFVIQAVDEHGNRVETGILTTKRMFWYVQAKMTGLAGILSSTSGIEAEYAKHHMMLKKLPDLSVAHQENIGSGADTATLRTNVNNATAGSAAVTSKNPHTLVVAYTDHLAVKNANQRQRKVNVDVGPGKPNATIRVTAPGLRNGTVDDRALWHNLVTGEGWFVSARYTPNGGGAAVAIPEAKVSKSAAGWNANYFHDLVVDVTGLPAGRGTIEVFVDVVDRMRAGLALGGANQTCVCTIAWWNRSSQNEQRDVIIHEFGHKVHMVADGTGSQPDRVATQYTGRGHVGSHCHNGAPAGEANYATSANHGLSNCVMFGSTNSRSAFCSNCAPAVKKADINAGW